MRTALHHWLTLWQRVGAVGDGTAWHDRLIAAYNDPARSYHNVRHLEECLTVLDEARGAEELPNADAIELALWFHDAIYDPKAGDNEERSATLAQQALQTAGVAAVLAADVVRLVLSTKAHAASGEADAGWMSDIDLSILGRERARFDEYEPQIRDEYAWVPVEVYAAKRSEILAGFLKRERLFVTEHFHRRYERLARENLAALIARLGVDAR